MDKDELKQIIKEGIEKYTVECNGNKEKAANKNLKMIYPEYYSGRGEELLEKVYFFDGCYFEVLCEYYHEDYKKLLSELYPEHFKCEIS